MLTDLTQWAINVVYSFGYVGVFFLMVLGNMNLLVPTQLTLPLAGFLVGQGYFSLILVLVASTAGSLAASVILYCMGLCSGESLRRLLKRIKRFDKLAFILDMERRASCSSTTAGRPS